MWREGPKAYRDLLTSLWTVLTAKCGWPKMTLPRQSRQETWHDGGQDR